MRQTPAQRRASMRNLRKARASRSPRRRRSRRRRRNPSPYTGSSMPVVLVNPSSRRRRSTKRRNPRRTTRRRRRRSARVRAYTRRLPNPTTTWGGAFATGGLGMLGGLVAGGLDWGAQYLPIPAWGQALALFGAGGLTSVALGKWADVRVGAGIAGGTAAILVGRVRSIVALSELGKDEAQANGNGNGESAAVWQRRRNAGAVYTRGPNAGTVIREAGQLRRRQTPYSMAVTRWPGAPTWKVPEAGASYYMRGPVRHYGPQSWIHRRDAGAVYVSAHNR